MLALGLWSTLAAEPVFIADAHTRARQDGVEIVVRGEGALDARVVHTVVHQGGLTINMGGTRARSSARRWEQEIGGTIHAHRHADHTELDVPLPSGAACNGPARVSTADDGAVVVRVACAGALAINAPDAHASKHDDATNAPGRGAKRANAREAKTAITEREDRTNQGESAPTAAPTPDEADRRALSQALAPDKPIAADSAAAPAATPSLAATTSAVAPTPAAPTPAKDIDGKAPSADTKDAKAQTPAVPANKPADADPLAGAATGHTGWTTAFLPVVALLGLGGLAVWLGRKRRAAGERIIKIIETQSLGPKRSLIVARLGGETLVLGASEAGITLLRAQPGVGAMAAERASSWEAEDLSITVSDDSTDASPTDGTDEAGQVRFLTRLFGRDSKSEPAELPEAWPFENVLEESLEDQELRTKLSAGVGGRVP